PSLQPIVLFTCVQPVAGSHPSVVQTLPSLQLSGVETQAPAPLQASVVHALPSVQALPAASKVQVAEQQSPLRMLPSSHCSPGSRMPFPQGAFLPTAGLKMLLWMPPAGRPGPSMRKKLVAHALPVSVWSTPGLTTMPAGGGVAPVAKLRKGPVSALRAGPKAAAVPRLAGTRALSRGELVTPGTAAVASEAVSGSTPEGGVTV